MRRYQWLIFLFLTACMKHVPGPIHLKEKIKIGGCYHQVFLSGPIDVTLHTGAPEARLVMKGRQEALHFLKVTIHHDKLLVNCDADCQLYGRVSLDIAVPQLRAFYYDGIGRIQAHQIHAPVLDVAIYNPGFSEFTGRLGLRDVNIEGGGTAIFRGVHSEQLALMVTDHSTVKILGHVRLSMLDIKDGGDVTINRLLANRLTIREHGDTALTLVGCAKWLDLNLWGRSRFWGRHFQTGELFVRAHQKSAAEVTTAVHQHIIATGDARVNFYRLPETQSDFMVQDGAILNLHSWMPVSAPDPYVSD